MGIAGLLLASQVKPGGMFDPQKIIGQLQGKPTAGAAHGTGAQGQYGQSQQAYTQQYGQAYPQQPQQQQHSAGYPQQQQAPYQQQTQQQYQPQYGQQVPQQYLPGPPPPPHQPTSYDAPPTSMPQPGYQASYGQSGYQATTSMPSPGAPHSYVSSSPVGGFNGLGSAQFTTPHSQPPPGSYGQAPSYAPQQSSYGQSYGQPAPTSYHSQGQYGNGGYDSNRGVGTAIGVGAAAYGAYQLAQKHKLPFGASHVNAGPNAASDQQYILQCLIQCVNDQRIQAFYPPGSLEPLAQQITQSGAIQRVAAEWNIRPEVAIDLVRLSLFDVVLYLDDSGSMKFEEHGTRIDDLRLVVERATAAATLFDHDGISMRWMNSEMSADHVATTQMALQFLERNPMSGMTPLGTNLSRKVLEPLLLRPAQQSSLKKPVLVIMVTDGEPTGEDRQTLVNVIRHAKDQLSNTRYGPDALSIELAQVGTDNAARRFLQEIDQHPVVGSMIDVTSDYEHEAEQWLNANPSITLTPELYVIKLLLGGVDAALDSRDERKY
ncbi:hypothetical protein OIO90_000509 [Microbotryomycetes sp. JL221]|nr:hypothetical protein OIO90_000509 [Microbotryomycetes sp. JL221]